MDSLQEKELFDRVSVSWMKKDLVSYCREARKLRLFQTLANAPASMGRVLEVGCGAGFSARYLHGRYDVFTGIDISPRLIELAREHNMAPNRNFHAVDITGWSLSDRFDVIFMIGVLHHLPRPVAALERLGEMLAPGGMVAVNEPLRGNPLVGFVRRVRKRVDKAYSPDQITFSPGELARIFRQAGFETTIRQQGILTTPFAETVFTPESVGDLLVAALSRLDPVLEWAVDATRLPLAWNMVAEGRLGE
ncbi:MAG: class I SAM-dependent methyltransferase [Desulfatibacillaceae bacterium]